MAQTSASTPLVIVAQPQSVPPRPVTGPTLKAQILSTGSKAAQSKTKMSPVSWRPPKTLAPKSIEKKTVKSAPSFDEAKQHNSPPIDAVRELNAVREKAKSFDWHSQPSTLGNVLDRFGSQSNSNQANN